MNEAEGRDTRARAEAAFQRWLDRFREGEEGALEAEMLAGEPDDVREEVQRMIADYHALLRQHDVAVLFALALGDADHHALAVDVLEPQMHGLARAKPSRVKRHQDRAVLEVRRRVE